MTDRFQALVTRSGDCLEYQISRLGVMAPAHAARAEAAGHAVGEDFPVWQVIGSPATTVRPDVEAREFAVEWVAAETGIARESVSLQFRML